MQQTKIKIVVLLSLLGFFLGIVSISFHHHDQEFLLPACSICKVKASLSGTFSTIKINTVPAVANGYFLLAAFILCLCGMMPNRKSILVPSQIVETYPNKAPPFSF